MDILFSSKSKEYEWLSNFSRFGFVLEDKYWATVEHYFQAKKFLDLNYQELIRNAKSALKAKKLGGSRKCEIHSDWKQRRVEVMRIAIRAKFEANPALKQKLIATGSSVLKENNPYDSFWGIGRDGHGKNTLGQLLMELRESFK